MKNRTPAFCSLAFLCMGLFTVTGQDSVKGNLSVERRTLMNKFEPNFVLSVAERIALKQNRLAHQFRIKKILDTLDISNAKKRRLLKELNRNPFSDIILETISKEVYPIYEKSN